MKHTTHSFIWYTKPCR